MKKALIIAAVFSLMIGSALAQTVSDQVNAPENVQSVFASNTGKTVVTIDAAVHVPNAEQMYVIPVSSVAFDDGMVTRLGAIF